ncbi:hypothetical protein OsI_26019 [Oryza sativa Indica Group]|uniref:Uncharacterized protein n=1 Tax=Oryza sativa subsp. indica TaxID=39946 RepID=A2YLC4_ORYSI|nr:hypothetical protein OsI_26019 [Oryza sativa Indica Group]
MTKIIGAHRMLDMDIRTRQATIVARISRAGASTGNTEDRNTVLSITGQLTLMLVTVLIRAAEKRSATRFLLAKNSNMDGGSADHAAKKKKANTSTPESSNAAVSGPTPMQLVVTPLGDRRPVPQRQQIILGTRVYKQHIAVTLLRVTGSTSYGRREVSLLTSTAAPAAPTSIVLLPKSSSSMDTPPGLTMAVSPPTPAPLGRSLTSTPPPSAPVQTLPASTPPMQTPLASSRQSTSAPTKSPLVPTLPMPTSFVLTPPLPTTTTQTAAYTHEVHVTQPGSSSIKHSTFGHVRSPCTPLQVYRHKRSKSLPPLSSSHTPVLIASTLILPICISNGLVNQEEKTEGLCRSNRCNAAISSNGIAAADEDSTTKAKRRSAMRNLDGPMMSKMADLAKSSLLSTSYLDPSIEFDSVYVPEYGDVGNSQEGLFPGLFISDGFVFPPSEHENLPIESDLDGSNNNNNGQESSCAGNIYEGCNEPAKEVDGRSLSVSGDLHSANETTIPNLEPPEIHAEQVKDNATIKCDLPCEGWLKRKSNCLSHRMKGVTTVCTIVAAGALMGFVIIGQRWQQDKLHLHHFQFNIGTEGGNRIVGIFSRCKDALPSSQQLKSLLPTRVLPQEPLSA